MAKYYLLLGIIIIGSVISKSESTCSTENTMYNIVCGYYEFWCETRKRVPVYETVCKNVTISSAASLNVNNPKKLTDIEIYYSSNTIISPGMVNTFPNLERLYIQKSNINTILGNAFVGLSRLDWLVLKNNNIIRINSGAFKGLPSVTSLNLYGNKLTSLNNGTFNGLSSVKYINLNYNNISTIEENTFSGLKHLGVLIMSRNHIGSLSPKLFLDNDVLRILWIQFNNIKTIPGDLLMNKPLLNEFHMHNNQLEYVNCSALKGNVSLQQNQLKAIIPFGAINTSLFNLSFNQLASIPPLAFEKSHNMTDLLLNNNIIREIHDDSFVGLEALKILALQNNELRHIPIGAFRQLKSLQTLNMSQNYLERLEIGVFTVLTNLLTLDLSRNKLTTLQASLLYTLEKVRVLYVNGNTLRTLDVENMLVHLKGLKEIDIDDNQWDCEWLPDNMLLLKKNKVSVIAGTSVKVVNVNGISCNNLIAKSLTTTGNYPEEFTATALDAGSQNSTIANLKDIKNSGPVSTHKLLNTFQTVLILIIFIMLTGIVIYFMKKRYCKRKVMLENIRYSNTHSCHSELIED